MPNNIYIQIGKRIQAARKDAGYSQQEVADMLKLSDVGYGMFERGARQIGIEYLLALSRILGKPVTWFLGLPSELSAEEDELVALYRLIEDPALRKWAVASLRALAAFPETRPPKPGKSKTG